MGRSKYAEVGLDWRQYTSGEAAVDGWMGRSEYVVVGLDWPGQYRSS